LPPVCTPLPPPGNCPGSLRCSSRAKTEAAEAKTAAPPSSALAPSVSSSHHARPDVPALLAGRSIPLWGVPALPLSPGPARFSPGSLLGTALSLRGTAPPHRPCQLPQCPFQHYGGRFVCARPHCKPQHCCLAMTRPTEMTSTATAPTTSCTPSARTSDGST
jgi:hypothetical protein